MLAAAFARDGRDWPLLVQGEGSRSELLARFRELGNAILLGSASFREGVDVPGAALSVVIIDKLPFAPPDDPLLAARLEHLRAEGGNPFFDYQLPQAVIALKQGAGRLIRTETDRGVLMICDPRLTDKPYGKRIWQSLPPMRRTRELEDVEAFFGLIESRVRLDLRHNRLLMQQTTQRSRRLTLLCPRSAYQSFHHGLGDRPGEIDAVGERLPQDAQRVVAQLREPELVVALDQHVERALVGRRSRIADDRRLRAVDRGDVGAAVVVVAGDVHLVPGERVREVEPSGRSSPARSGSPETWPRAP